MAEQQADRKGAPERVGWDKSGLRESCQRALTLGRTRQDFDIQLLLDMLSEIERLESADLVRPVAVDVRAAVNQIAKIANTCECSRLCDICQEKVAALITKYLPSPSAEGERDYCNCLMPLGSKTCHHCKKVVRPAAEGEQMRAAIAKVKAIEADWRRQAAEQYSNLAADKADAAAYIITALESDHRRQGSYHHRTYHR